MVEAPIAVLLVLLCVSLAAVGWAILPVRNDLVVRGKALRGTSSYNGLSIVCEVAGNSEVIVRRSSSGLFRVGLPRGCIMRMKFLSGDELIRMVVIEHRQENDQYHGGQRRVIDLGDIRCDHSGDPSPVHAVVTLHGEFLTVTDRVVLIRKAPLDRQLLDRDDQLIGVVRKAG